MNPMSIATIQKWTCNLCGDTAECYRESVNPKGWIRLSLTNPTHVADPVAFDVAICPACSQKVALGAGFMYCASSSESR